MTATPRRRSRIRLALTRSEVMARIKGTDTEPEVSLRQALWGSGLRYRLKIPDSRVRADVVFPRQKVAVFVDGCFWHGCPEHYVPPRTSRPFWAQKLIENVDRDRRQTSELEAAGWRVLRFWEHEVATALSDVVARIRAALFGGVGLVEPDPRVVSVSFLDEAGDREERHLADLRDSRWSASVVRDRSTRKW